MPACTSEWIRAEGAPSPPGVSWLQDFQSYNFTLYSKFAESVTLLLYKESDVTTPLFTRKFDYLRNKTGRVWHCLIPEVEMENVSYYAYSIDGPPPGGPLELHCFDPQKILVDPYARAIFFPEAFDRVAAIRPGSNAGRAPLGVIPHQLECNPRESRRKCVNRHEFECRHL